MLKVVLFFPLTVDLRSTALHYTRAIVVPRVPLLRFLLPDSSEGVGRLSVGDHLDSVRLHYNNNIILWHDMIFVTVP